MGRKKRIFISYSRRDASVVDEICSFLPSNQADVFVDRAGIHGAEDFVSRIAYEIGNSDMLLFIASKNSFSSRYVSKELHYALEKNIAILPYFIDNEPAPDNIAFLLGDINHLDIHAYPPGPALWDEILNAAELRKGRASIQESQRKRNGKQIVALIVSVALILLAVVLGHILSERSDETAAIAETRQQIETAMHQADSLRALNNPELTGEREIDLLLAAKRNLAKLDSTLRVKPTPETLPAELSAAGRKIDFRLDSMYNVWKDQARIALSLYKKTHINQERTFAEQYLRLAGKINKDSEWERMHASL